MLAQCADLALKMFEQGEEKAQVVAQVLTHVLTHGHGTLAVFVEPSRVESGKYFFHDYLYN